MLISMKDTPRMQRTNSDSQTMNHEEVDMDMIDPDDPLLIAQSLTYVTDNGSVLLSYSTAPVTMSFRLKIFVMEVIFMVGLIFAIPYGAHGEAVIIAVLNLAAIAWYWYNSVRSVEVTMDGGLRFWIGNYEMDIPFDKVVEMRRITSECSILDPSLLLYRGFLTNPGDGVVIVTSVATPPFFMWPRSAGKPERKLGPLALPRLKIIFSPSGGSLNFIKEVETEMRSRQEDDGNAMRQGQGGIQPPSFDTNNPSRRTMATSNDYFDV